MLLHISFLISLIHSFSYRLSASNWSYLLPSSHITALFLWVTFVSLLYATITPPPSWFLVNSLYLYDQVFFLALPYLWLPAHIWSCYHFLVLQAHGLVILDAWIPLQTTPSTWIALLKPSHRNSFTSRILSLNSYTFIEEFHVYQSRTSDQPSVCIYHHALSIALFELVLSLIHIEAFDLEVTSIAV